MTFKKVSVLVPTRKRIARLRTLITSFDYTTGNAADAELVFRVDEDDVETRDFLSAWGGHKVIVGPRLGGYRSMPTFFNELALAADGDVLMCGNDDMIFKTLQWPSLLLAMANRFPDGLFDIGVDTHNALHFPFSVVSKHLSSLLGFVWDPRIFWGDIFLRDVMAVFNRCIMLETVEVEHDWAGFNPDTTFFESDKGISADYWPLIHQPAVSEAVTRLQDFVGAPIV